MPAPTTVTSRSALLMVPIMTAPFRVGVLDPGLPEKPAQHGGELGVAVERARAVVVCDALFARLFGVEPVQLEEGLDVVADEADGRDDDAPGACGSEPLQLVFEVRLEPGHPAVA